MQNLGGSTPWRLVFWKLRVICPAGPSLLPMGSTSALLYSLGLLWSLPFSHRSVTVRTKQQLLNISVAWCTPLAQTSSLYHRTASFENSPAPALGSPLHCLENSPCGQHQCSGVHRLLRAGPVQSLCSAPWSTVSSAHGALIPPARCLSISACSAGDCPLTH